MIYTVVRPYYLELDSTDLTSAVRKFTKIYYNMKINELIIKDQYKHYKATMKYFNKNGRKRVGINFFPSAVVVPASKHINQVFMVPRAGNVVRKDGTIQEYNYSPVLVSSKNDDDDDDTSKKSKTIVMMPGMHPAMQPGMVAPPMMPGMHPAMQPGMVAPPMNPGIMMYPGIKI